jgi:hypothetical protein
MARQEQLGLAAAAAVALQRFAHDGGSFSWMIPDF